MLKMEDDNVKKIIPALAFILLLVGAFLVLKPIILSVIFGFILAFIFAPVYRFILRLTKSPNFSAVLLCIILILLIVVPLWLFTPMLIEQSFKIYQSAQQTDFVAVLKSVFPSLFSSQEFSQDVGNILHTFVTRTANSFTNSLTQIILDAPNLLLQFLVVLFTFYFVLRDEEDLARYLRSLIPFSKSIQDKIFFSSKEITRAVLYGMIVMGFIQGVVIGIGFFIFGVPSAWILTLLAIVAGILPIIGTVIIWFPVLIYFSIQGDLTATLGILIFGIISTFIDNIFRPFFVAKRTKLHSTVVLIGMIGGIFPFGVLGIIIGPLILAYLLIILDVYRDTKEASKDAPQRNV
jgi:predicted PurR-regulated permease PerM